MNPSNPVVIWQGTVPSGTFRIVDRGAAEGPRFVIEQQQLPDALGGIGWATIGLPLADVLEVAFAALYHP